MDSPPDDTVTAVARSSSRANGARIVEVDGIVKRFGRTAALDGMDLHVEAGQVHGFLGPNGAGKSTTIRALLGLLRADSGRIRVFGSDPWRDAVAIHRRLAYVPGDVALWPSLSGGEAIDVLANAHDTVDRRRRDRLVEEFALDPSKRCSAYSKGNRQKVALVAAFSLDADLILLDEPTSGLDPLVAARFESCVREAVDRGATVLLSSHVLSEVESLCSHVTMVRAGRAVRTGTLDELRRLGRLTVSATTRQHVATSVARIRDVEVRSGADGASLQMTALVPDGRLDDVTRLLVSAGIEHLTCEPPTLEDLLLSHYETVR